MKVFIKGKGEVTLSQRDFIAKGGEKSVYALGDTGYAIYDPPSNMIPVGKIKELSVLAPNPNIIIPRDILMDAKNRVIGHTMRFIREAYALTQLFNKPFQQKNGITDDMRLDLVRRLRDIVAFIHSKGILVIDLNELNFLVDKLFREVFAIDTNSYQTPSYPATVIMDSIKDRHCNGKFTCGSDWFSWAVVSFQMLVGMHPYRGRHPDFECLPPDQRMNARMEKNVSVFHKDATMPRCCDPLDSIPLALRDWYVAVFERGERMTPPDDFEQIVKIIVKSQHIGGGNVFVVQEIETYEGNVWWHFISGDTRVVCTEQGLYVNRRKYNYSQRMAIGFTPKMNRPWGAYIEPGTVVLTDLTTGKQQRLPMNCEHLMSHDGRIYLHNGTNVLEVMFNEVGDNTLVSTKQVGRVLDMPNATRIFDGVIFQNMLGRFVASIFPESGKCYQLNIPELDGYRVVDAKYMNHVLAVVGEKKGKYDRLVLRCDEKFAGYDVRTVSDIQPTGLNFTVTDAGTCVLVAEDETIEAFSNRRGSMQVRRIDDPVIESDMRLFCDGSKVLFAKGDKLYSLTMRNKP